jgi:hypothetical protein
MHNAKRTILIAILVCAGFVSEEEAVNQKNGQGSILLNNLCLQNDFFMSE